MLAKEYLPASMILNKKYGFWFDMGWGKVKRNSFFDESMTVLNLFRYLILRSDC